MGPNNHSVVIGVTIIGDRRTPVVNADVLLKLDSRDWGTRKTNRNGQIEPTEVTAIPDGSFNGNGKLTVEAIRVGAPGDMDRKIIDIPMPQPKPEPAAVESIAVTNATEGIVLCSGFNGTLEIALGFEQGKKSRPVRLKVSADHRVDFANDKTGTPLGANVKSCAATTSADGVLRLRVNFLACGRDEVEIKVSVPNSSKTATAKLKYKMFET